MIAPRKRSMDSIRGCAAATEGGTISATPARSRIGAPFKNSNDRPMNDPFEDAAVARPTASRQELDRSRAFSRPCRRLMGNLGRSLFQEGVQARLGLVVTGGDRDHQAFHQEPGVRISAR